MIGYSWDFYLEKDKITIGNDVIISNGWIVFRNLPNAVIAVGKLARIVKTNDNKRAFGVRNE